MPVTFDGRNFSSPLMHENIKHGAQNNNQNGAIKSGLKSVVGKTGALPKPFIVIVKKDNYNSGNFKESSLAQSKQQPHSGYLDTSHYQPKTAYQQQSLPLHELKEPPPPYELQESPPPYQRQEEIPAYKAPPPAYKASPSIYKAGPPPSPRFYQAGPSLSAHQLAKTPLSPPPLLSQWAQYHPTPQADSHFYQAGPPPSNLLNQYPPASQEGPHFYQAGPPSSSPWAQESSADKKQQYPQQTSQTPSSHISHAEKPLIQNTQTSTSSTTSGKHAETQSIKSEAYIKNLFDQLKGVRTGSLNTINALPMYMELLEQKNLIENQKKDSSKGPEIGLSKEQEIDIKKFGASLYIKLDNRNISWRHVVGNLAGEKPDIAALKKLRDEIQADPGKYGVLTSAILRNCEKGIAEERAKNAFFGRANTFEGLSSFQSIGKEHASIKEAYVDIRKSIPNTEAQKKLDEAMQKTDKKLESAICEKLDIKSMTNSTQVMKAIYDKRNDLSVEEKAAMLIPLQKLHAQEPSNIQNLSVSEAKKMLLVFHPDKLSLKDKTDERKACDSLALALTDRINKNK